MTPLHPGTILPDDLPVLDRSDNRTLQYIEFAPPADLSHWVEGIAFFTIPRTLPTRRWRLIPDARIRLWIPLQGVGHAILHPGSTVATDVSAARAGTAAAIRYTPWVSGLLGNQHAAVRPRFDVDALQRRLAGDDLVDGRYRTITAWLGQALHDLTSDHRLEIVWQQLTDHTVSPNIESIARAIGTSSRTLRRLIHRASHCTFRTARELERLRSACRLLRAEIDLPWARASCQAGYCDQSHLCRAFRRWVGMPPGRFFGEGHHHLNDVFARRVHTTVAGYAVVAVGHPELRPLTPPHSLMREKRNSSARPRPV